MSDTTKLKPCPFCGGDAKHNVINGDGGDCRSEIQCHSCGAEVGRWNHWCDDDKDRAAQMSEAVTAWNTRPAPEAPTARAEALLERVVTSDAPLGIAYTPFGQYIVDTGATNGRFCVLDRLGNAVGLGNGHWVDSIEQARALGGEDFRRRVSTLISVPTKPPVAAAEAAAPFPQAVRNEIDRVKSLSKPTEGDKEDLATYAKEIAELRTRTAPEYDYDMGVAGDEYIKSIAFAQIHHLPADFKWCELWDALNAAVER